MTTTSPPLVVNGNPATDQLKAAVRTLLVACGGYVAGKGWLPPDVTSALVPVILIGAPFLWGQVEARMRKRQLVAAAEAHPEAVEVRA